MRRLSAALVLLTMYGGASVVGCRTPERAKELAEDASPDAMSLFVRGSSAAASGTMIALDAGASETGSPSRTEVADAGGQAAAPLHVQIKGVQAARIYAHGAETPRVDTASFVLENEDDAAHSVSVLAVEFLREHGGDCSAPPTAGAGRKLVALGLHDKNDTPLPSPLSLLPHTKREVRVVFEPVEAYYGHCDRFGFRATFSVDGRSAVAVAGLRVGRVDAPRR